MRIKLIGGPGDRQFVEWEDPPMMMSIPIIEPESAISLSAPHAVSRDYNLAFYELHEIRKDGLSHLTYHYRQPRE